MKVTIGTQTTELDPFGLFELDAAGTVLYHRVDAEPGPQTEPLNLAGRNFYDEFASFENAAEFRRYINEFAQSTKPADSFHFDCRRNGQGQPVRVLLARIREAANPANTKSILVHIRRVI